MSTAVASSTLKRSARRQRGLPFSAQGPAGLIFHTVLVLLCISVVFPFVLMISGSLTQELNLSLHGAFIWPRHFSTAAYQYAFKYPGALLTSYGVTFFITIVGTVGSLLLTTMIAYAISRTDYIGARVTTFVVFFTMLFNGGLVPFFILMTRYLHLQNSIWAMIVPGLISPFTVLIMKGYMARLNYDVIEAAKIDGASEFRIFFTIVAPMVKPAIATLGVLISFSYWNEWFNALLFIDKSNLYPLQLYVYNLSTSLQSLLANPQMSQHLLGLKNIADVPYLSAELALTLLSIAPFTIVFVSLQRYFREGLTVGSLKG